MSEEEGARTGLNGTRGNSGIYCDWTHTWGKIRRGRPSLSRKIPVVLCFPVLCFLVAWGALLAPASAQNPGVTEGRVVEGRVVGSKDQPLQNAVVYLEDEKSTEIKTYITQADGKFRFGELSSDVDYRVWAAYQNRKSKAKSISSFDSRNQFDFDPKVDTEK
jgi:hypothetical protein